MASHKDIEDRAAAWLAKRDSGNWSADDQAQLVRWLQETTAHRVAFLRLEDVWDETRRLKALGAGRTPGIVPPPEQWRSTPFFDSNRQSAGAAENDQPQVFATPAELIDRSDGVATGEIIPGRKEAPLHPIAAHGADYIPAGVSQVEPTLFEVEKTVLLDASTRAGEGPQETPRARDRDSSRRSTRWRLWAIAASIFLALGIGSYIALSPAADRFSTPIGGIESVPLRDGSNITLNTASSVRVDLTPHERIIDLQRGEAFFKVAKDPTRPFVVRIGDKRVVAVGTQFSVRRDGDDIRIVVTEGTVRLESVNGALSGSKDSGPKLTSGDGEISGVTPPEGSAAPVAPVSTSLPAGTIAHATDEDVLVEKGSVSQAEEILSWRQGYLRFHDTTLADAIAEFNRYNTRSITIDDPTVAAIRISGTFRPTNYEAFVRLLGDGYSIRAEDKGGSIILTKH